ncbi:hypothetical protein ADUPG1_001844 [Aduncisulcus paluster]|uniref:Uncharacterized protein n=1 Tax=Aduncisulcus paluster TaxID=2918883 RepID=A0ABQ5KEX5_9EUKA|nr:hypothetical protein ADUPG1_001844 [Aduncisulcus paluster]
MPYDSCKFVVVCLSCPWIYVVVVLDSVVSKPFVVLCCCCVVVVVLCCCCCVYAICRVMCCMCTPFDCDCMCVHVCIDAPVYAKRTDLRVLGEQGFGHEMPSSSERRMW